MKMLWKIALKNCIKHKWMTLVLTVIFAVMTISMFWVFGFSNYFENAIVEMNRTWVGDVMYAIDRFIPEERLNQAFSRKTTEKVSYVRVVGAMADGQKNSGFVWLKELDKDVEYRYREALQPFKGRMPRKSDEILVQEINYSGMFHIGDAVYITTSTTKKVINTLRFKVVGINKTAGFFITPEAMDSLLDSKNAYNQVWVLKSRKLLPRLDVYYLDNKFRNMLAGAGIYVYSTNIYNIIDSYKILVILFRSIKILLLIVLIPLSAAVIAAIVWMTALKRRKEIWTYSAIGLRDGLIMRLMIMEFLIVTAAGFIVGIAIGTLSAILTGAFKVYLVLGSLIQMPLLVRLSIIDLLLILLIAAGSASLASLSPLNKIIKAKPFSY
jgi:ABC-type lipoprotein release transport system permease subunit